MPKKKLIRVSFHYSDGTVRYLDGKELKKWEEAAHSTALIQYIHSGKTGFEDIKFKEEKRGGIKEK